MFCSNMFSADKVSKNTGLYDYSNYIERILRSGLILDEDMEVLLSFHNENNEVICNKTISKVKLLLGISVPTAVYIIRRKFSCLNFSLVASFVPLLYFSSQHLLKVLHNKKQRKLVEVLVENLVKICKINKSVCDYLRNRSNASVSTENVMSIFTQRIHQLVELILKEESELVDEFKSCVEFFANYLTVLKTDYAHLEQIDCDEFEMSNIESVNDCIMYLQKLSDIVLLVISNTLTCLALIFIFKIHCEEILNTVVAKMSTMSEDCYMKISDKFDDIKYGYINIKQTKILQKPKFSDSLKLHTTTSNVLVNTSDIIEKSHLILERLKKDNLQSVQQKEEMFVCINELRNQVYNYYESLNILVKFYEITLNCKPSEAKLDSNKVLKDGASSDIKGEDASLNLTEPLEDEEYELYIGDENFDISNVCDFDEQESYKYIAVLSRELKLKLKEHARFIAARKKRGIIDEEIEPSISEPVEKDVKENNTGSSTSQAESIKIATAPPLPPPPPPAPILTNFVINDTTLDLSRTMNTDLLKSLKTVSVKCNEDVFQTSDVESEDSEAE